jgi:hypothetical protein
VLLTGSKSLIEATLEDEEVPKLPEVMAMWSQRVTLCLSRRRMRVRVFRPVGDDSFRAVVDNRGRDHCMISFLLQGELHRRQVLLMDASRCDDSFGKLQELEFCLSQARRRRVSSLATNTTIGLRLWRPCFSLQGNQAEYSSVIVNPGVIMTSKLAFRLDSTSRIS